MDNKVLTRIERRGNICTTKQLMRKQVKHMAVTDPTCNHMHTSYYVNQFRVRDVKNYKSCIIYHVMHVLSKIELNETSDNTTISTSQSLTVM